MANDDYESVDVCGKDLRGPFDLDVGQYQEMGDIYRRWVTAATTNGLDERAYLRLDCDEGIGVTVRRMILVNGIETDDEAPTRHEAYLWGMPA